jgi:hypothetical protein
MAMIVNEQDVERIYALNGADWEAYAKVMAQPEGWKVRLQPHDTGTGVAAFDSKTGMGLLIQPLYHDDVSGPAMLVVSGHYPLGTFPTFTEDEFRRRLEPAAQRDLGSRYSVRVLTKKALKFEIIEMIVCRNVSAHSNKRGNRLNA